MEEPLTACPEELLKITYYNTGGYQQEILNLGQEGDPVFINQEPDTFIPEDLLAIDQDSHH